MEKIRTEKVTSAAVLVQSVVKACCRRKHFIKLKITSVLAQKLIRVSLLFNVDTLLIISTTMLRLVRTARLLALHVAVGATFSSLQWNFAQSTIFSHD